MKLSIKHPQSTHSLSKVACQAVSHQQVLTFKDAIDSLKWISFCYLSSLGIRASWTKVICKVVIRINPHCVLINYIAFRDD